MFHPGGQNQRRPCPPASEFPPATAPCLPRRDTRLLRARSDRRADHAAATAIKRARTAPRLSPRSSLAAEKTSHAPGSPSNQSSISLTAPSSSSRPPSPRDVERVRLRQLVVAGVRAEDPAAGARSDPPCHRLGPGGLVVSRRAGSTPSRLAGVRGVAGC